MTTTKRKSWLKRIALVVALLLATVAGVATYAWNKSGGRPDWYRKRVSPEAIAEARKQSLAKMAEIQSWLTDQSTYAASTEARDPVATDPTTPPAKIRTLTLSENELNVMLEPFEPELKAKFGQYVTDPYIRVHDGHLVLAITLKDAQKVLSLYVQPRVDKDGFTLAIDELQLGTLSVPRFMWRGYLDQVALQCKPKLDDVRKRAAYLPNGNGNAETVASAMNRLLLRSIANQSADPVLFLPSDGKFDTGLPVRVTEAKIDNEKGITLTFEQLTHKERVHLLARLRAPYGEEPAPGLSSGATAAPPPAPVAATPVQ